MRSKSLTDLEHKFLARTREDDSFPRFKTAIADAGFPAWLAQHDPSQNRKYVRWVAKRYLDESIKRLEDIPSTINSALTRHMRLSQKRILPVEQRNIDRFKTPNDLMDMLDQYRDIDLDSRSEAKEKEEKKFFDTGDAVLIHDDENYKIVVPKTEEASKFFGKNTRWCTAAENYNAFSDYAIDGDLYIILHKPTNKRWQVHFQLCQFMDETDNSVDYWNFCEEHSSILDILSRQADKNDSIMFMPDMDDENTLLYAVEKDPLQIEFIKNPSEAVQLAAAKTGSILQFIPNPSQRVLEEVLHHDGMAILKVKNPTEELQIIAVRNSSFAIRYIKNPTMSVMLAAVANNPMCIEDIENPPEEIQIEAVSRRGSVIQCIKNPSEAVQIAALKANVFAMSFIENPTELAQLTALEINLDIFDRIKKPCKAAVDYIKEEAKKETSDKHGRSGNFN